MSRHIISYAPHGADCSCGRSFSIWAFNNPRKALEAHRFINLVRGNAHRHADAANRREET